jgi:hypothetical protein
MSLPKITHPTFKAILPSSGKEVSFRPMTNREQKSLLVAKESDNNRDSLLAAAEVVGGCFSLKPEDICLTDLEYMFLSLRSKSVGNKVDIKYKDQTDGKTYEAVVDLDDIKVEKPEGWDIKVFEIPGGIHITMKDPDIRSVAAAGDKMDEWDIMLASIKSVTQGDDVTLASEVTRDELKEWMLGLPASTMENMQKFFVSRPKIKVKVKYFNSDGIEKVEEISGFSNFFG